MARRRGPDALDVLWALIMFLGSGIVLVVMGIGRLITGDSSDEALPQRERPLLAVPDEHDLFALAVRPNERLVEYPLAFPLPPEGLDVIRVQSDSDPETRYEVDRSALTCTCHDFQARRAQVPATSVDRCCKHLSRALDAMAHLATADPWLQAIAAQGHGWPSGAWIIRLDSAPEVLATVAPSSAEWVNVLARTKQRGEKIKNASGPIEQFGWSVVRNSWSYGEGPPGARELSKLMRVIFERVLLSDVR